MIILGIETATTQVGCAFGGVEGVLGSYHSGHGKRHAETLMPAVEFLSRQCEIGLKEVSVVAVDVGPGLFTGLRVGISAAKALAHALRVPMIGMPSLDLLAYAVRWSDRRIVAIIDARRGEVFHASYRRVAGGVQRMDDYRVSTPEFVAAELSADRDETLIVGDGALRYRDMFESLGHVEHASVGQAFPTPDSLVELAQPRALREEFVQPVDLQPLYLRKSDAEVNLERRPPGDERQEQRV